MAHVKKTHSRPISLGYDVIYPPGCKEITEDIRPDELKKRLKELWSVLTKMSDSLPDDGELIASTNDTATLSYLEDLKSSNIERKNQQLRGLLLFLLSEQYTQHHDPDVKLRIGACLCSIARIYCPDSPFEGMSDSSEYKKKFLIFIINCIKYMAKLKSKEDPNYMRLYSIFSICCQIDLFVWTLCVDDGQDLLHEIFRTVFYIMRNYRVWSWLEESKMKAVVHDMLSNLLVHCESILDTKTVTFFLQCLIEPTKSAEPEQHDLAKEILLRNSGHLEYLIHMLIQGALVTGKDNDNQTIEKPKTKSKEVKDGTDVDLDDEENESEQEDDEKINSGGNEFGDEMFLIIYALHSLKESLVAPILPTIEVKLKSSQMKDRKRACRLLVRLFSESNSTLSSMHPTLWEAFLGRFNDIESEVRETCVRLVPHLLKNNSELPRTELLATLKQRAHDPVENVRHLVLRTVAGIAKDTQMNIPDEFFSILVDRARDKSLLIRKEVLTSMAGIYKNLLTNSDKSEKLPVLLNTIMHMYYQNSTDDRVVVESLFKSAIVPFNQSSSERMRLLIHAYSLFDEASVKAFQEMLKIQFTVVSLLREIVEIIVENQNQKMTSVSNKDIADKIAKLSAYMPLRDKSIEHLKKFFSIVHTDRNLRQFLVKLTSPVCPCNKAAKIMNGILKRQSGFIESGGSLSTSVMSTVKCLLQRASPVLFDPEAGQEMVMQLVICRDAGPNTSSKMHSDIQNRQSLRLIYAVASYFKDTLPHVDLLEYIIGVLTTHINDPNTSLDNSNAFLVEKYCLEILCCILGGGVRLSTDSPTFEQEEITQAVFKQIVKKADSFFPLLTTFCTKSRSRHDETEENSKEVDSTPAPARGRGKKITASNPSSLPSSVSQSSSQTDSSLTASLTGWWADSKIAKFTVKCLQFLFTLSQKEETFHIKVKDLLQQILKECIACPKISPSYIPCLTTLGQLGLLLPQLFSKDINDLLTNDIIPNILWCDSLEDKNHPKPLKKNSSRETATATKQSPILTEALTAWSSNSELNHLTIIKVLSVKLISRWLFGMKSEDKDLSSAIIRLLYNIIVADGDLTTAGKMKFGEMSRMRLVAANSWLKLAQQQNYIEVIEVKWFHSMAVIIADPCENVRAAFLNKLHRGLLKLTLPLEYMAIFCYAAEVPDTKFKQSAKQCLHANVARRKEFLHRHPNSTSDSKLLFALLPDNVLPYAVHLLAHDKNWTTIEDGPKIAKIKACLWFVLEAIVVRGDSFSFLRKLIEKMKHSRDALSPDNEAANQKLYTVCDVALGLVLSKSTNFVLKEYPVEVKLPRTLFARAPSSFSNPEFKQITNGKDKEPPIQFTPNKYIKGAASEGLIPNQLLKAAHPKKAGQSTAPSRDLKSPKSRNPHVSQDDSPKSGPSRPYSSTPAQGKQQETSQPDLISPISTVSSSSSPKKRGPQISIVGLSSEPDPEDIVNISPSKKKKIVNSSKDKKQDTEANQPKSRGRPKANLSVTSSQNGSSSGNAKSTKSSQATGHSESEEVSSSPVIRKRGRLPLSPSTASSLGSPQTIKKLPTKSAAANKKPATPVKKKVMATTKKRAASRKSNRHQPVKPSDDTELEEDDISEQKTAKKATTNNRRSSRASSQTPSQESKSDASEMVGRRNSRKLTSSQEESGAKDSPALSSRAKRNEKRKRPVSSSQESEDEEATPRSGNKAKATKSPAIKVPKITKSKNKNPDIKQKPEPAASTENLKIRSRREASRSAIMDLYKSGGKG